MGGIFDPEMPKLTKRPFPTSPFFGNTDLQIFGDTPRNCTSMIIELQPSQIYFAFTQNQKLICNGEMQNRCRVQLSVQINIFLLKKEHLSATNQSSSCICLFYFSRSTSLFDQLNFWLHTSTSPFKDRKDCNEQKLKANTFFFSGQIYVFFDKYIFFYKAIFFHTFKS